jgi:peptide/nickel transport system substrate-binding protein
MTRRAVTPLVMLFAIATYTVPQAIGQQANRGGTVVVAYTTEPSSLAPWRSGDFDAIMVYTALYDTLLTQDAQQHVQPGLSDRFQVSPDRTSYTFYLHRGVTFHDGEALNAAAVKWNVDRWANPPKDYINGIEGIKSSQVLNDLTVQITLNAPNNHFLTDISSPSHSVLPPKAVQDEGENFSFKPVGTGPYKFDRWVTDSEIDLVRNPDYWRTDAGARLPYLDRLVFRVLPDQSSRETALMAGDIDVNTTVPPQSVAQLQAQNVFTIFNRPNLGYDALRLLTTKPPFNNKQVRQAVSWAVDRDAVNKAVYFGLGIAGSALYSPSTPGYDPSYKPYVPRNLATAKQLLAEAGVPNGFTAPMIVGSPVFQQMAVLLQAQLAEVGIRFTIQNVERGVFLNGIVQRQWTSYLDRILVRTDPSDYYDHLRCGAVYNGHDYCNHQLDSMVGDGLSQFSSLTDPKRVALFRQAERTVMDDAPLVILDYPPIIYAWKSSIHGIVVQPTGRLFWAQTWR